MKRAILFFLFTCSLATTQAQENPYQFHIKNLKDTVVYLANYYGDKLYYADTAYADSHGNFSFKKVPDENQGKYAVVIPGPKFFEFLIADDEDIEISSDTTDLVKDIKVLKSKNNKVMYEYTRFLTDRRAERDELVAALDSNETDPSKTKAIKEEYNKLNDRVVEYQKEISKKNMPLFVAKEILMSVDPDIPPAIRDSNEASYFYFKDHYFDNIDLSDDRIVRTPIFHTKLINYLNKTLVQNPDSIIKSLDKVIATLDPKSEVFKYIVHYSTYNFETSKIMGMDKVFVHLVDKYYDQNTAFWMDADKLKKIQDKANEKRYTLIGMKAPELVLMDTSGNWISTYKDIHTKYTVLYFYDADCGHCKKETPVLVDFYKNYKDKDLSIYAVCADHGQKWRDFIKKYDMGDFYNLTIPEKAFNDADFATNLITSGKTTYQSLKYLETFDVYSTPKVYILDENKIIKAKDIAVEQIDEILTRLKQMDSDKDKAELK